MFDFKNKKFLVGVGAAVILLEIAWVIYTLTRPIGIPPNPTSLPQAAQVTQAKLILSRLDNNQLKVGNSFTVIVTLDSPKPTDGTDVIIKYDPKILSVESSPSARPVKVTQIYAQYPVNSVDAKTGRVVFSGIKAINSQGFVGRASLGTITFTALSLGETTISVDFQPNSTTDSNVIESASGLDILEEVINLNLKIQ